MRALFVGERRKSRMWLVALALPIGMAFLWLVWDEAWTPQWSTPTSMTQAPPTTSVTEPAQEASAPEPTGGTVAGLQVAPDTGAPQAAIEAEVQAVVAQWARHWSQKNIVAYLDAYAADFKPEGGKSLKDWTEERKQRIVSKKSISVQIESLGIVSASDQGLTVSFVQVYAADQLTSTTRKSLILGQREGRLRILREFTP